MSTRTMSRRAAAGVLLGAALAGAQAPPDSAALLEGAKSEARRSQRAIFAIFHASW